MPHVIQKHFWTENFFFMCWIYSAREDLRTAFDLILNRRVENELENIRWVLRY